MNEGEKVFENNIRSAKAGIPKQEILVFEGKTVNIKQA